MAQMRLYRLTPQAAQFEHITQADEPPAYLLTMDRQRWDAIGQPDAITLDLVPDLEPSTPLAPDRVEHRALGGWVIRTVEYPPRDPQ